MREHILFSRLIARQNSNSSRRWWPCQMCRSSATSSDVNPSKNPSPRVARLLDRALAPFVPTSARALADHMAKNVVYHQVGDVLALEKPYGVSCLGYIQKDKGVFGYSRHDAKGPDGKGAKKDDMPTVEEALPFLREHFQEPGLHFCVGLKRWTSGPLLLPCTKKAFHRITHSVFQGTSIAHSTKEIPAQHIFRALAICISRPKADSGTVLGYAMHEDTGRAAEYNFVEGTIKKRARNGEFASMGEISYEVLASRHGLSLVDLHFSKFVMHFPRLFCSHLGAPILGDPIYTNRLLDMSGQPTLVGPKEAYKGSRYEPVEFLRKVGANKLDELRPKPPLFLAVYQTTLPFYGDTHKKREVTELRLGVPPPEHFLAMTDLLGFTPSVKQVLDSLDEEEDEAGIENEGKSKEEDEAQTVAGEDGRKIPEMIVKKKTNKKKEVVHGDLKFS